MFDSDYDEQGAVAEIGDFDGDLMEDGAGLVMGLGDYDEADGFFEDESKELDDEDGRPLDSIYRF